MRIDITCDRLAAVRPDIRTVGCCESCHVDHEEAGYDLCSIDLPGLPLGAHYGGVCCRISVYLGKNPITNEELEAFKRSYPN